jgi:hypothetical protein
MIDQVPTAHTSFHDPADTTVKDKFWNGQTATACALHRILLHRVEPESDQ